MARVTALILTLNEEVHIARAVESLLPLAAEVVVVDSGSTDQTVSIAETLGCRVLKRTWDGYASQLNWAMSQIDETDWIVRLDADEYLTARLQDSIREAVKNTNIDCDAFEFSLRVVFMGKWIRHGGYYPSWIVRMWKPETAQFSNRLIDERLMVDAARVRRLEGDFVDENLKGLGFFINKHNRYSDLAAAELFDKFGQSGISDSGGVRRSMRFFSRLPPLSRAFAYWIYRLVVRGGFLDGVPGVVFHTLQGGWYRFLVDAKVIELQRGRSPALERTQ